MHDDDCDHDAVRQAVFERQGSQVDRLRELDSVIAQFGAGTALADRRLVARALYEKAKTFAIAGKHADAVKACTELRARFEHDDDDEEVLHWFGEMLVGSAVSYSALWLPDLARSAYREAVTRFGDAPAARLRAFAPRALCDECVRARDVRDVEASIAAASEAERFANDSAPEVRSWAERAMQGRGLTEERAGRADDAIRSYERVYELFGCDADAKVRGVAISAGFDAARVHHGQSRREEAIARYAALAEKHANDDAAAVHVAKAWLNIGVLYGELGEPHREIAMYDQIDARLGGSGNAEVVAWVAMAMRNKAIVQRDNLHDREGAKATLHGLIERHASDPNPVIAREVQRARADLARL